MHKELKQAFDILESQRKKTLDFVRELSTEQFNWTPNERKWSIAHILSHIVSAERLTTIYVRKKMQGAADAADAGWWEHAKFLLLKASQRLPWLKFKAPKKVVEHTEVYADFTTLSRQWENVRIDLKAVLEKIPEPHARRKIFRHVRAGYLSVGQGLLFLREHIIHHTPQIKKLANHK